MPFKFTMPKLTISTVKDIIYILGIIVTILFYFRDKAVRQAVLESKYNTIIENQNNIFDKFKEDDIKWYNQALLNGQTTEHIRTDTN
jgi:hypothetical protein